MSTNDSDGDSDRSSEGESRTMKTRKEVGGLSVFCLVDGNSKSREAGTPVHDI